MSIKTINTLDPAFMHQFGPKKQEAIHDMDHKLRHTHASLALTYNSVEKTFTILNSSDISQQRVQEILEVCKHQKWAPQISGSSGENKKITLIKRSLEERTNLTPPEQRRCQELQMRGEASNYFIKNGPNSHFTSCGLQNERATRLTQQVVPDQPRLEPRQPTQEETPQANRQPDQTPIRFRITLIVPIARNPNPQNLAAQALCKKVITLMFETSLLFVDPVLLLQKSNHFYRSFAGLSLLSNCLESRSREIEVIYARLPGPLQETARRAFQRSRNVLPLARQKAADLLKQAEAFSTFAEKALLFRRLFPQYFRSR